MLRTALLVAGKDLRQRLRDRSALVIAFVAPFVLASIIGLAFGGDDAFKATYAVADADKGPVATGFTDGVLASPGLRDLVTVRQVDAGEARALVDRGDADAAFLLPAGFSASVERGGAATITVVEISIRGMPTSVNSISVLPRLDLRLIRFHVRVFISTVLVIVICPERIPGMGISRGVW